MMRKEHERIEREELDLRNNIENAKKLRLFLNKHLESTLKSANNASYSSKRGVVPSNDSFWNGWPM